MASKRNLAASAQCRAMQGSNHRFGTILDLLDDFGQMRRLRRAVELADVCPGKKGPACAMNDDCLDIIVICQGFHALRQTASNRMGKCVYRRIVDRHYSNCTTPFDICHFTHAIPAISKFHCRR